MHPVQEELARSWNYHQRGIISSNEFAMHFMGTVAYRGVEAVDAFRSLPDAYQAPIATYIECTPIKEIEFRVIGDASEEYINSQTELLRDIATNLRSYLAHQ